MESSSKFNFPYELKDAVHGLDHEIRIKILECLINQEKMKYSEIKKELNLDNNQKGSLNYHLKILSQSALVDKFTTSLGKDREERSYYKLSQFAIKLIRKMMSVFDSPNIDYEYSSFVEVIDMLRNNKDHYAIPAIASFSMPSSDIIVNENNENEMKTITKPTNVLGQENVKVVLVGKKRNS
jgi:hypothetical protein